MHNDNQEWTHTAMRAAMDECDSTPYKMMGFAILGGIAMAFSPIAAGVLGIGGIIWCQKKEIDSCNRAEFAALYGAAGVAAKGQMLKEYVADVGREEVAKQLLCAARMNRPINQDGWNLLEDHYGDEKLDELLDEKTETEDGSQFFAPAIKGIGSATAMKSAAPPPEAIEEAPKDALSFLRSLTIAPLQPVIIAGLPGSGKGVMAAIALTMGFKEAGLKYWVFNPKNQLKEAGYWSFAERHYLKNRLLDDEDLFVDLMGVLEEFASEGARRNEDAGDHVPFVLLLEEIGAIVSLFSTNEKKMFKAKVIALASLLRSSNMAIWFSGQSVNLEDLGLSGKSNRAIFTSIVAVGKDRESARQLCSQLELPFDTSEMGAGRYWITSAGNYPAVQAPQIPTYASWADVPNVFDLRPAVEEIEETYGEPVQVYPVEYRPSAKERLEEAFRIDSTEINEVEAIPDPVAALLLNYADDPKTESFLKWIADKPEGEVVTREQVRCSYWAKQNGRDKESIDLVLIEAINTHLLIETDQDFYKKRDIGTSGHPKK